MCRPYFVYAFICKWTFGQLLLFLNGWNMTEENRVLCKPEGQHKCKIMRIVLCWKLPVVY